jgi:hypothetical protein
MPRKPHFVLAARRWGWPLSPSYGRVRGLMTSVMGWKPKAETASWRVRFTTAWPRSARDAQHSNLLVGAPVLFLWQRTGRMCYSVQKDR